MEGETKRLTTNIPKALLDRIMSRAEALWGTNNSESNVVAGVLRDWLSQSERGALESRLDQMERRIEHLLESRPADGFQIERPSLNDSRIQRRLGLAAPSHGKPHLPMKPSVSEIEAMGINLVRAHRKTKLTHFGLIHPAYLLGYESTGAIDYLAYERAGFPLSRSVESYRLEDPSMKQFAESCWVQQPIIHAPLLIYFYGKNLVILDGVARFTAVVEAWKQGVCEPCSVPFELYVGDEDNARKEMILRNLHGGPRSLTRAEFERAVDRLNGLA